MCIRDSAPCANAWPHRALRRDKRGATPGKPRLPEYNSAILTGKPIMEAEKINALAYGVDFFGFHDVLSGQNGRIILRQARLPRRCAAFVAAQRPMRPCIGARSAVSYTHLTLPTILRV